MPERVVRPWPLAALAIALTASSAYAGQVAGSCEIKDDDAYTAAIRKATTETYFSTELVDHLPWSSCVPAPDTYLGHIIGAPDVLDHVEQINLKTAVRRGHRRDDQGFR